MTGELLCLGAYFFMKYVVHREDPESFDNDSKPVSPLIMLPVTQILVLKWKYTFRCILILGLLARHCLLLVQLHWSRISKGCWFVSNAESITNSFLWFAFNSSSEKGVLSYFIHFIASLWVMSIFQRLPWFKWTGILLVCIGLVVKAIHPKARFQKVTNI